MIILKIFYRVSFLTGRVDLYWHPQLAVLIATSLGLGGMTFNGNLLIVKGLEFLWSPTAKLPRPVEKLTVSVSWRPASGAQSRTWRDMAQSGPRERQSPDGRPSRRATSAQWCRVRGARHRPGFRKSSQRSQDGLRGWQGLTHGTAPKVAPTASQTPWRAFWAARETGRTDPERQQFRCIGEYDNG